MGFAEQFHFKSMDELRAYAEVMKPHLDEEGYKLMLYLFGLLENQGDAEPITIEGEEIKIDKFLVPIIKDLNDRGVKTLACCSGLQVEHPDSDFKPSSGYISLVFNEDYLTKLQAEITDPIIEIRKSESYLKPSINITIKSADDSVLKEKWFLVWDALKELNR